MQVKERIHHKLERCLGGNTTRVNYILTVLNLYNGMIILILVMNF